MDGRRVGDRIRVHPGLLHLRQPPLCLLRSTRLGASIDDSRVREDIGSDARGFHFTEPHLSLCDSPHPGTSIDDAIPSDCIWFDSGGDHVIEPLDCFVGLARLRTGGYHPSKQLDGQVPILLKLLRELPCRLRTVVAGKLFDQSRSSHGVHSPLFGLQSHEEVFGLFSVLRPCERLHQSDIGRPQGNASRPFGRATILVWRRLQVCGFSAL
mmetsp:Transcript_116181/g.276124  ORF Transcript_116181/g.276124 Transcript_116181/m.276124 type:complete len:211 (+) Transcript_116181:546-1178(+)